MTKLTIPSVLGVNTEGMSFGTIVFLQSVEDNFKTLDNNVIYKDAADINIPPPRLEAVTAQGHAFSISGVNVASGDDHAALTNDVRLILQTVLQQQQVIEALTRQLQE